MGDIGIYTAETLAFAAGLPLRTVRFYVQEKLIDPPLGRGPGKHFGRDHLVQLQQARTLQNAGFSLEAIREGRGDLSIGLRAMETFAAERRTWSKGRPEEQTADAGLIPDECIRIPMANGVELMVSQARPLPSPRQLVEIALHIQKAFGGR